MSKLSITNGRRTIRLKFAGNILTRAFGLGFRRYKPDIGMYFKLPFKTKPVLWNFGMFFPISIGWVSDGKIIHIASLPKMTDGLKIIIAPEKCDAFVELDDKSFMKADWDCAIIKSDEL